MASQAELEAVIKLRDEMSQKLSVIEGNVSKLTRSTGAGSKNISQWSRGLSGAGSALTGLNPGVLTLAGGVAAATAALVSSVKASAAFEKQMVQIETLVGRSSEEVAVFSGQVLNLSGSVGKGPVELAEALFNITSAGLEGSVAMK